MTTLNTTELYPKICRWLGMEIILEYGYRRPDNKKLIHKDDIDFLHDHNQLQWIEDKLRDSGYSIKYEFHKSSGVWEVGIWNTLYSEPSKKNKSRPLALLQAVEELLNQEEKK